MNAKTSRDPLNTPSACPTELTPRASKICATLGPALRQRGLIFVGIDVINGKSHRNQRHLANPHPRHRQARRPGFRRDDLGRDRKEARDVRCERRFLRLT